MSLIESKISSDIRKYRAIDLFAGIGGIRLGFQQVFGNQIEFVFSNEIDKNACKTYEANFGLNPEGDITKLNIDNIPDFDILLAGFPCQAFSIAGRQKGFEDTRGTLFFYVAEIINKKRPVAFLLENVKNLQNHDSGRTFQVIKDVLEQDLNYTIYYRVLNAKDYSVPQNRERIFIVGFRDPLKFKFPEPLNSDISIEDILEKEVDNSYYLSHEYLSGLKKHRARHEAKGNGFGYEVVDRNEISNALVCGGMGKERNLVKDRILKNCWKNPDDDKQLRNCEGIRKMTEREWSRLQGFPDSFTFPVAKTHIYRQLGNSVAVPVIKALAEEIKRSLSEYKLTFKTHQSTEERLISQLFIAMFEKHQFTKSGKKTIKSIEKFISKHAIRINNLPNLVKKFKDTPLIIRYNDRNVFFNPKLSKAGSIEDLNFLINKLMERGENSKERTIDSYIELKDEIY